MRIAVLCVAAILVAGNLSAEITLSQVFDTRDDFTIRLPTGWVQIPKDAIDAYLKEIAKLAPQASRRTIDYGFQLDTSSEWFQHPYIVVQVKKSGRIPDSQLKSLPKVEVERALQRSAKKAESVLDFVSRAEVGKTLYDSAAHILWWQTSAEYADEGKVRILTALILTEQGIIQVMNYALATEFDDYAPLFETIVRNVSISEAIRYKPQITDSIPIVSGIDWGGVLGKALVGAVIGGIFGLFAWMKKKKAANKPNVGDGK